MFLYMTDYVELVEMTTDTFCVDGFLYLFNFSC